MKKCSMYKWCVFLLFLLVMPTLFFAFAAAGVGPALTYYIELIYQLVKVDPDHGITFEIILYFVHSVVWTFILYLLARLVANWLCNIKSSVGIYIFSSLVAILLLVGLVPIYGGGHSIKESVNVYQLYGGMWDTRESSRDGR